MGLKKAHKKTHSERLRAVFYNHYVKEEPSLSFDEYYESKMEMLIEHYKNKLNN